ncbi:uncharacterized protein LOC133839552 isoform X2 [Drosophila sulfurigaster albostrigata]|uniref:uncharacterized protein LOC133839552 isoform X2 n=1 Tax=Drosophila sulfurigaster albostrigata TaxID=89887 RepID=UPI002D21E8CC|nr:uncharacterized protein LOC133839552 isoform X2 [Drosophila sulfurigaster albostrigata]
MNMKCNCGESSGRPVMNEAVTLLRLLHKSDNQKEKRRTRKQPTAENFLALHFSALFSLGKKRLPNGIVVFVLFCYVVVGAGMPLPLRLRLFPLWVPFNQFS